VSRIRLDLNDENFQEDFFNLERAELLACIKAFRKIRQFEWDDLYRDSGLNWERIGSRVGPEGFPLYSFRVTQQCRAVAYREGGTMVVLELHPGHDGAY
jgi:hypothetical protein